MSEKTPNTENLSVEHRTLAVFRQVLARVVREITPAPGMRHPLSDETVEDIKQCFALIAAREREIQGLLGDDEIRKPVYPSDLSNRQEVDFNAKPTLKK